MRDIRLVVVLVLFTLGSIVLSPVFGADEGVVILDNNAEFRTFMVYKTPIVRENSGALRLARTTGKKEVSLPDFLTPLPAKDWLLPLYGDFAWEKNLCR